MDRPRQARFQRWKDMDALTLVIAIPFAGVPIVVGLSWWMWLRIRESMGSRLRRTTLTVGVLAATTNAITYYSWLAYRVASGGSPTGWRLNEMLGDDVGLPLCVLAAVGAVAGPGVIRVYLGLAAILGFLLWVNYGVL